MQTSGIRPRHCPTFGPHEQPHRLRLIAQDDGIVTWNLRCYDWQLQATTYQESIQREREGEGEGGRGREGGREVGRKIEINPLVHIVLLTSWIRRLAKCHLFEAGRNLLSPILFCAAMGLAPPCRWTDLAQSPASKTVKTVPIARPETGNDGNTLYQRACTGGFANCVCVCPLLSILVRTCLGASHCRSLSKDSMPPCKPLATWDHCLAINGVSSLQIIGGFQQKVGKKPCKGYTVSVTRPKLDKSKQQTCSSYRGIRWIRIFCMNFVGTFRMVRSSDTWFVQMNPKCKASSSGWGPCTAYQWGQRERHLLDMSLRPWCQHSPQAAWNPPAPAVCHVSEAIATRELLQATLPAQNAPNPPQEVPSTPCHLPEYLATPAFQWGSLDL